jgi:aminoglycoside phosphotransferase family enzyme
MDYLENSFISDCLELAKAKVEYEKKNPETKKGNINRLSERAGVEVYKNTLMNFTDYIAKRLGKNRRVVQNEIRIGEKLSPAVYRDVIDLGLSKAEIYFLSGLNPEWQRRVISVLKREPVRNILEVATSQKLRAGTVGNLKR